MLLFWQLCQLLAAMLLGVGAKAKLLFIDYDDAVVWGPPARGAGGEFISSVPAVHNNTHKQG